MVKSINHLRVSFAILLLEEVPGDVRGQNVVQELICVPSHLAHFLQFSKHEKCAKK